MLEKRMTRLIEVAALASLLGVASACASATTHGGLSSVNVRSTPSEVASSPVPSAAVSRGAPAVLPSSLTAPLAPGEVRYVDAGVRLLPAEQGATATVSSQDALKTYLMDPIRPDLVGQNPQISLVRFNDDEQRPFDASTGSVGPLKYQNVLAWAFTYQNAAVVYYGGVGSKHKFTGTCPFVYIADAGTGQGLDAYQACK